MGDVEYFCSYIATTNKAVSGYGDFICTVKAHNTSELLGDIKSEIINKHYSGNPNIQIVITALNRL